MPSVLFVCTGNIARSPMAEAMFRRRLEAQIPEEDWVVESAGTWAQNGQSSPASVHHVMRDYGFDVSRHRARRVSDELLAPFDLIVTMERGHKESIQVEFPIVAQRTFLLSEMIGQRYDVPDPSDAIDEVRRAARLIDSLLTNGYDRIVALAQAKAGGRATRE